MANSPGPSSSNTIELENCTDSICESTDNGKKKKRTRRKPRSKVKKEMPETDHSPTINETVQQTEQICTNFMIEPMKEQSGVFYKQRDQSFGHIKLNSYIKNTIPSVFITRTACDHATALSILEKIGRLSINGITLPKNNKSSPTSENEATTSTPNNKKKKKEKKKKTVVYFPDYIPVEQVKIGLKNGSLMKGAIRINPKNIKESYVGNEDVSKVDYIIATVLDRNRALDGDQVVLRFKTETEDKKKLMEVVYITQKVHPRTAVGFLEPIDRNKEYALFIPRDRRIPKIKIPKISWPSGFQTDPQLYRDILLVAKLSDWKEEKFALGTITENLGLNGDLKVESLAILRELCLDPRPFGDDIKSFLPRSSEIPREEFGYREDLRRECIFTIDPATARDLDDAVSWKRLDNGNFEVGVHISDASFYLKEGTRLDEQVKKRATTIYMVDSVYHMLPVELCLQCSLLPGEDKMAFSVIWEMTSGGEIVNRRIVRSVIRSCAQLSYEHAQMMIEQPDRNFDEELPTVRNGFKAGDLSEVVNGLQRIAVILREKRYQNGSLRIDQVKISFALDPLTGKPSSFYVCENKASHRLIEEFMLLANMTVAQWIYDAFPDLAFLRLHEAPKPTMMNELQKVLETVGIHIDITSSGGIQASLNKYIADDFFGHSRMVVLNHLLAKPMKRARYFCAGALDEEMDFTHFALSIPIYTHFTSPIRRYADIMTHRLVAASLNYTEKPKWRPDKVAEIAETCNRQKYHAKKAGEASSDLYLVHFIEENQPYVQDAVVVDTKERSIDVIVLSTGNVIRIYTNTFGEGVTWKSEEIKVARDVDVVDSNCRKMWKMIVKFAKTAEEPEAVVVLEMFTLVRVELFRKPKTNKLDAKLVRPVL